jgi:hypothetical protein
VFGKRYDKDLEEYVPNLSIATTIPHYEYDWPGAVKELSKEFTDKTFFYIQDEQKKYRVYDRKEWETMPRDEFIALERSKSTQEPNKLIGELVDALKKGK